MKVIFALVVMSIISSAHAENTSLLNSPRKLKGPTLVISNPPQRIKTTSKPKRTKQLFLLAVAPTVPEPLMTEEKIKETPQEVGQVQTIKKFNTALVETSRSVADQINLSNSKLAVAVSDNIIDTQLADGSWLKLSVITIGDGALHKMNSKMRITTNSEKEDVLEDIKNILASFTDIQASTQDKIVNIEIPVNIYKLNNANENLRKFVTAINEGNLITKVKFGDALTEFRQSIKACNSLFKL